MPPVFSAMSELYLAQPDAIHALWRQGTPTLIHGDVHDGNLFTDGGRPGFLDWALVARGPGMRDLAYFVSGSMSPDDREAQQEVLITAYQQRLLERGVFAPEFGELWQQYQHHVAYVWVGATVTLAMGDAWQPAKYSLASLRRINRCLEQLDSVSAIGKAIA